MAARYGGEEFVLLLGETDNDVAVWIATRLCQMISELNIPHYATASKHVTVSCGVASVIPGQRKSLAELLKAADFALYQAKNAGRDQVSLGKFGVIN
jgi:diguanylate cyclase (GGDEF)-like protein